MTDTTVATATVATTGAAAPRSAGAVRHDRGRDLRIAVRQLRWEHTMFWRSRRRAFFALGLPLMFLLIFSALYGNDPVKEAGGRGYLTLFIPGILAYGVIMATFTNLAATIAHQRDLGILKRVRTTPLPRLTFLAATTGAAIAIALELTVVTLAVGELVFGVDVPLHALPGLALAVVAGAGAFSALGIGIVRWLPNSDSAGPAASFVVLPLTFISGIWSPIELEPDWLRRLAEVFPIARLSGALQHAYDPAVTGAAISGTNLLVLGAWFVVGARLTQRFLRSQASAG